MAPPRRSDRVVDLFYFIAVAEANEVSEIILDYGEVIQVITNVGRKDFLVPQPDDALPGLVRGSPEQIQSDLVSLYERSFLGIGPIDEEVDVSLGFSPVGLECRVHGHRRPDSLGLIHKLQHAAAVPRFRCLSTRVVCEARKAGTGYHSQEEMSE